MTNVQFDNNMKLGFEYDITSSTTPYFGILFRNYNSIINPTSITVYYRSISEYPTQNFDSYYLNQSISISSIIPLDGVEIDSIKGILTSLSSLGSNIFLSKFLIPIPNTFISSTSQFLWKVTIQYSNGTFNTSKVKFANLFDLGREHDDLYFRKNILHSSSQYQVSLSTQSGFDVKKFDGYAYNSIGSVDTNLWTPYIAFYWNYYYKRPNIRCFTTNISKVFEPQNTNLSLWNSSHQNTSITDPNVPTILQTDKVYVTNPDNESIYMAYQTNGSNSYVIIHILNKTSHLIKQRMLQISTLESTSWELPTTSSFDFPDITDEKAIISTYGDLSVILAIQPLKNGQNRLYIFNREELIGTDQPSTHFEYIFYDKDYQDGGISSIVADYNGNYFLSIQKGNQIHTHIFRINSQVGYYLSPISLTSSDTVYAPYLTSGRYRFEWRTSDNETVLMYSDYYDWISAGSNTISPTETIIFNSQFYYNENDNISVSLCLYSEENGVYTNLTISNMNSITNITLDQTTVKYPVIPIYRTPELTFSTTDTWRFVSYSNFGVPAHFEWRNISNGEILATSNSFTVLSGGSSNVCKPSVDVTLSSINYYSNDTYGFMISLYMVREDTGNAEIPYTTVKYPNTSIKNIIVPQYDDKNPFITRIYECDNEYFIQKYISRYRRLLIGESETVELVVDPTYSNIYTENYTPMEIVAKYTGEFDANETSIYDDNLNLDNIAIINGRIFTKDDKVYNPLYCTHNSNNVQTTEIESRDDNLLFNRFNL